MSDKVENKNRDRDLAVWEKPSLQRVGHVGEVFQMPGEGKLSIVADDMGDVQRKPKGQE